jgi:hypothetical protein
LVQWDEVPDLSDGCRAKSLKRFPMSSRRRVGALLTALLGLCAPGARAQDAHYWTLQYGPVAELLGGVVVGSSRDLSASFYNPGALAMTDDTSVLASVQSFEATRIKASAPPDTEFSATSVKPSPTLFAFAFPRSLTGSHTVAISGLTRQDLDVRFDNWTVAPSGGAGAESVFDQDVGENWFGLSWAHGAGERFGVGLTTYVVYRGQRTRSEVLGQAALSSTQGAAALLMEDFRFSNYRLLWKAGISTQRESWDLGLSVTTASVGLFGSGSASYVRSAVGADLGSGPTVSVAVQHQEDLSSSYRSPWSVAAGGAHRRGQNSFHATVEWFASVSGYDVIDPSPFASDPAAARLVQRLHQEAKSVLNFGVGYQREASRRFSYYGAFTTDFTYADQDDPRGSALATWNIYHASAGASLMVGSVKLTMGAAYSFGNDERTVSMVELPPGGPPVLIAAPVDTRYRRVRMLVGFDFGR